MVIDKNTNDLIASKYVNINRPILRSSYPDSPGPVHSRERKLVCEA